MKMPRSFYLSANPKQSARFALWSGRKPDRLRYRGAFATAAWRTWRANCMRPWTPYPAAHLSWMDN